MKVFAAFSLLLLLLIVMGTFWFQEIQYQQPTPVPQNYQAVAVGQPLDIAAYGISSEKKPVLLHFFNADCPCSRFNIDHFNALVSSYGHQIDFYAVLQVNNNNEREVMQKFKDTYNAQVPVIVDKGEKLSKACGIYATPQAVIIDQTGKLYYRGNYNVSRYCTAPGTSFAEIAVKSVLQGAAPPQFIELATTAYGCQLPSNRKNMLTLF